ncbi:helix-turn-helix domain-containing protein [Eisenbergiella porci]|uniref:helix-turn-helix domain-containing protein n=1 Tax=Eisenbergiella porci TaxID=2652274 RepID=UPI002A7F31BF|nr:helix-turn-helix transcriptional regulator [Eisenbergiella porci]
MKTQRYPVLCELKGLIRSKGKTYRSLSKETGISVDALNNKLNGYSPIDSDDVEILVNALEIDPSTNEIVRFFLPNMLRNATETKPKKYN